MGNAFNFRFNTGYGGFDVGETERTYCTCNASLVASDHLRCFRFLHSLRLSSSLEFCYYSNMYVCNCIFEHWKTK